MVKTYTIKELQTLVRNYPGDKKVVRDFIDWCESGSHVSNTDESSRALVELAAEQWFQLCLEQIRYKHRKKQSS